MQYKKRTPLVTVKAVTFDQLIEHGLKQPGANIVNGMPWSFTWEDTPITHETDDRYLIVRRNGDTLSFNRKDMLVCDTNGSVYSLPFDMFDNQYELLTETQNAAGVTRDAHDTRIRAIIDDMFQEVKTKVVEDIEARVVAALEQSEEPSL